MYARGQRVVATVERILPFGVFVRFPDGTRAYIRRRELTLSGDHEPSRVVSEGQPLQAVVTALGGPGSLMELSVRDALPDPWQEFARQHHEGDVVVGTVKRLLPDRAFVEILAGVDGVIPLPELASWPVERPEEVVWAGDQVEAVISQLDAPARRVRLSIRERLVQLSRAEAIVGQLQRQVTPPAPQEPGPGEKPAEAPELAGFPGPILVVEDHDAVREPLVQWLCDQGCLTEGARTAHEALERARARPFGLIVVDLDLPGVDGLGLIRELRSSGIEAPVAAMSGPELIAGQLPALQALGVATAFPKPLDREEIRHALVCLASGEKLSLTVDAAPPAVPAQIEPLRELVGVMRASQPLAERFRQGLSQLVRETRAQAGIVFRLDRVARTVSVVGQAGELVVDQGAVYGLVDSPVRDLIVEGGVVWEGRVLSEQSPWFRKLQTLLPFESCVGVPVGAEHALFLFHRERDAFSHYRLRDALAMATLLAVALESEAVDQRVRSLNGIFLSGQLAAGFGHEVYNKTSGLDLRFENARSDLVRLGRAVGDLGGRPEFQKVQQALDQAVEAAVDLKRTVAEFQRLIRAEEERLVDVSQELAQAEALVRPQARRARVAVRLHLGAGLPPVAASGIRLQQVFLNLMLNAMQQMEAHAGDRRALEVTTHTQVRDGRAWVQVRFADSGPGIHRELWESIFGLGFTTRPGGSGLGLYIARSLVEAMGGRIAVEESCPPLGTTFLVELPGAGQARSTG